MDVNEETELAQVSKKRRLNKSGPFRQYLNRIYDGNKEIK